MQIAVHEYNYTAGRVRTAIARNMLGIEIGHALG